jgi:hypothetical protein
VTDTVDLRAADTATDADRADSEQLRASARGWHGVQLAVLGFIGLCGALHDAGAATGPSWVQLLAAVLVIVALVVACVATVLVAAQAWPVRSAADSAGNADGRTRRSVGHLRVGITLTFVAVALTALATASAWWPAEAGDDGGVSVSTAQGSLCGRLLDSADGTVTLDLSGRSVAVPLDQVTGLEPVTDCPA